MTSPYYRFLPGLCGGGGFSPLALGPAIWLDPSDLTTLFQDSAGTTPVTANNDPVGRINDKSGNGRNLTQGTAAARPLYKTAGGLHWLEFDGADDCLGAAFALAYPFEAVTAFRVIAFAAATRRICGGNNPAGSLFTSSSTALGIFSGLAVTNANHITAADEVTTERYNGASSRIAIDNGSYSTGDINNTAVAGMAIGAQDDISNEPCNIRFYGRVAVSSLITDLQIAQLRTYLAAKQGRIL